jgi:hypothetical protein
MENTNSYSPNARVNPDEANFLGLQSRVADGTRTRNNQNHNLGLYH